jgi:hypothetical protein
MFTICSAGAREFTDQTGRKLQAEFVGMQDGKVGLQLQSGKVAYVPLSQLSAGDQAYIRSHPTNRLPPIKVSPNLLLAVSDADGNSIFLDQSGNRVKMPPNEFVGTPIAEIFRMPVIGKGECYVDSKGKIVLEKPEGGMFGVSFWTDDLLQVYNSAKQRSGFVDHEGKLVIPLEYTNVSRMVEGRAWVTKVPRIDLQTGKPRQYSLIDEKGEVIKEMPQVELPALFNSGIALINNRETKKQQYINRQGEIAIPESVVDQFRLRPFNEGYAVVGQGVLRPDGSWAIEPGKEWRVDSDEVSCGVVIVRKFKGGGEQFILSISDGKVIAPIPAGVELMDYDCKEGFFEIKASDQPLRFGLLDRTGKVEIQPQYKNSFRYESGYAKVRTLDDSETLYLNRQGKVIYREKK